jgi:asparagine synthase (glutamine-hydrolysing)
MLQLKLGLNSLGESYDIDLFAALHAAYGDRLAFWSGDGGDKILPDQRPWLSSEGRAGIAEYIVAKNQVWELDEVAWLTGVPAGEVLAGVDAVVRGYPESSPAQKYVRFMLAERAFRWISEGEDCNRHHYWTVSPFHSLPVFRAAMACPDDQKSGYRLYRALLRRMMPAVAAVADANLGMPMSSPLYPWYRRARELSRRLPRLQRLVRRGRMVSPLGPQSLRIAEVLRRQAQSSPSVRSCFSPTALESAIANADRKTPYALECLLTATSAVEEIAEGRSTLSDFADRPFG